MTKITNVLIINHNWVTSDIRVLVPPAQLTSSVVTPVLFLLAVNHSSSHITSTLLHYSHYLFTHSFSHTWHMYYVLLYVTLSYCMLLYRSSCCLCDEVTLWLVGSSAASEDVVWDISSRSDNLETNNETKFSCSGLLWGHLQQSELRTQLQKKNSKFYTAAVCRDAHCVWWVSLSYLV